MLKLWEDALRQAMIDAGMEIEGEGKRIKKPRRAGPTIPDLAEAALREHGPLTSRELINMIKETGRETNVNTVTVSLNRHRPKRFERNGNGKWCLATEL